MVFSLSKFWKPYYLKENYESKDINYKTRAENELKLTSNAEQNLLSNITAPEVLQDVTRPVFFILDAITVYCNKNFKENSKAFKISF